MRCPKCDIRMESLGYGDEQCPKCKHVEYNESEEDFNERINKLHNLTNPGETNEHTEN